MSTENEKTFANLDATCTGGPSAPRVILSAARSAESKDLPEGRTCRSGATCRSAQGTKAL